MPEQTFEMWDSVRDNEEKNIFPYTDLCALHIDSTMPYEIGILKPYLCRILPTVSENSPHRVRADAILSQMETVLSLSDEWVASDSLYKEFI